MSQASQAIRRPLGAPIILVLISAAHLAYTPLTSLRDLPWFLAGFALSGLLGLAYAYAAYLARRGRGFALAVNLIVGEDLGTLAAGLLLGYPWGDSLRPGTVVIVAAQLAFAFAEVLKRQEAGRRIVPATRLAWFVIAYSLAFAAYTFLRPEGLLSF